jgi:hypothetical protein
MAVCFVRRLNLPHIGSISPKDLGARHKWSWHSSVIILGGMPGFDPLPRQVQAHPAMALSLVRHFRQRPSQAEQSNVVHLGSPLPETAKGFKD